MKFGAFLASYAPITSRLRRGTAVYLLALRPPAVATKVTATPIGEPPDEREQIEHIAADVMPRLRA